MRFTMSCSLLLGLLGFAALSLPVRALADVSVSVVGDTALAAISLTDPHGNVFAADVTIVFDTPQNLTPTSLNLTAELVDPADIQPRLPLPAPVCHGSNCTSGAEIDPAFPMLVTIEPPAVSWLFADSFDGDGQGDLSFLNTYDIEVHTHDLPYYDNSPYRLMKAPVGGMFYDITNSVTQGSMRARGRGGAFSQFVVAKVSQPGSEAWTTKIAQLRDRLEGARIDEGLRAQLVAQLDQVQSLLAANNIPAAIAQLDTLTATIVNDAGTEIANVWTARRDVTNDAGIAEETSTTLRFSVENPGPPAWCGGDRGGCGD